MDTEKRDAIICVLDTIEAALQELRSLIVDEEAPLTAQLTPGTPVVDREGRAYYVTEVLNDGIRGVGRDDRCGMPVVFLGEREFISCADDTPSVTPQDGQCYRVLTVNGWRYSVWQNGFGWGAGGYNDVFAKQYQKLRLATPVIRVFPMPTA